MNVCSKEVNNFIVEALNCFACDEGSEIIHCTKKGTRYWYSKTVSLDQPDKSWTDTYNENMKDFFDEAVFSLLRPRLQSGASYASVVCEADRSLFIVGNLRDLYICFIPDHLSKELKTLYAEEGMLLRNKREIAEIFKAGTNIHPIRKFKTLSVENIELEVSPEFEFFIDGCNKGLLDYSNVIHTDITDEIKFNGRSIHISYKDCAKEIFDFLRSDDLERQRFMEDIKKKAKMHNHMDYDSGSLIFELGKEMWVEVRIGADTCFYAIPKNHRKEAKAVGKKLDLLLDLSLYTKENTTNDVDN